MFLAYQRFSFAPPPPPPRDAFFMDLAVPKHYDTWAKLAVDVQLQAAAFEKMRYKVYAIIEPVLCEHYVRPAAIAEQRAAGNTFANFQYAIYATDVTIQSAYRPAGSSIEQKQYLSRNHKPNGYKLECSVAYPGFAVSISVHAPGSKYDLTTTMERADIYRSMLNKTRIEKAELDIGEGVLTKRKARGETLSHDDLARNDIVASDHILVENLSRSKLWHVMFATYFRGLVWH
ncbi:hypothetical protein BBJ28_00024846 [Nothophytophthora sp. Chile5]|nr:hypothetical protein BBJ28_00024846 [Nothophytophthora sp. Chile5]